MDDNLQRYAIDIVCRNYERMMNAMSKKSTVIRLRLYGQLASVHNQFGQKLFFLSFNLLMISKSQNGKVVFFFW